MTQLQALELSYGRAGAEGKTFRIAFDVSYPTQALIHGFLAKGELCDPPLVKALVDFLQPGDTFIDVGSHVGYYSLLALQMVGPAGTVIAFEPNPQTFSVLLTNTLLNKSANFYAYNCAVGEAVGPMAFNINVEDEGMSSLVYRSEQAPPLSLSVYVTTLDSLVSLGQVQQIRMMKIDVEGFEENVIKGAEGLIRSGRVENIVFEINNSFPNVPKDRDLVIRKFLKEHGYTSYLVRPWLHAPEWEAKCGAYNFLRVGAEMPLDIKYGNILASRRAVEAAG